ncbi:hypothetical protein CIHG_02126 [Coccidioides immitis H538.4]|uniref:Uncharacterized protein n=1 Tax=Coccidioides immitis H538.4 TaxID=396776 RepID=A0A0J8RDX6_COCIT|nr:hypothetical protein CIHG_00558 [Coccidioides immitis H538.4]KMU84340.1 hypothetical protein CIHG_02126 [Coccidioides immitis H538.4]
MSFCKRRFNSGLSEFHITFKRLYGLREGMSIERVVIRVLESIKVSV